MMPHLTAILLLGTAEERSFYICFYAYKLCSDSSYFLEHAPVCVCGIARVPCYARVYAQIIASACSRVCANNWRRLERFLALKDAEYEIASCRGMSVIRLLFLLPLFSFSIQPCKEREDDGGVHTPFLLSYIFSILLF